MSSAAPTPEAEELSTSVLGIIGAYRMGSSLDPHALNVKKSPPQATDAVIVSAPAGNSRE